ncbi:MAG TPA: energy transducer TonB [Luteimonas sp.]|nr:energy transducer TonB [Luteimonas sp.]
MSASRPAFRYPHAVRLALALAVLSALAACGKDDAAGAPQAAAPVAPASAPPAAAVSAEVAALGVDELRGKARSAYAESRLYAPAGDNAMEYYLALRDKQPADAAVSSALTDLMPMVVIATEQSRDRDDFTEAQRLLALIRKADPQHPSLARLQGSIVASETALAKRAEDEKLTAAQEIERKAELEKERLAQQQQQQQQAAAQLATQVEQAAAAEREAAAARAAAAQREADERAAAQRAAQAAPPAAAPPAAASAAASAPEPVADNTLRALSTPPPRYPPEALRSGQSGEVQVEFTVNPDGSVANARVVRANPPRVFDREAVAAIRRWRFEPVGSPVTTRRTIGFNPGG